MGETALIKVGLDDQFHVRVLPLVWWFKPITPPKIIAWLPLSLQRGCVFKPERFYNTLVSLKIIFHSPRTRRLCAIKPRLIVGGPMLAPAYGQTVGLCVFNSEGPLSKRTKTFKGTFSHIAWGVHPKQFEKLQHTREPFRHFLRFVGYVAAINRNVSNRHAICSFLCVSTVTCCMCGDINRDMIFPVSFVPSGHVRRGRCVL